MDTFIDSKHMKLLLHRGILEGTTPPLHPLFLPYNHHHHHHHVVLVARISLILSRHFFLSFLASGRSSGLHPVSSHSCWMYVCAGRPALARLCVGVHKRTSLISLSLLLSVKQGGIEYHFFSLWYNSTEDWTPVSGPFGDYATY